MKKIITLLTLSQFLWISLAINVWDCQRLSTIKKLIPNDKLYQQAYSNLQKYCNWDKKVLNSSYYINHYLDVNFRYLDWFEENSDPQAKERRNYLNQIAEVNYKNIDKKQLLEKYSKYRWISRSSWSLYRKYIRICNNLYSINSIIEPNNLENNKSNIISSYFNKCYQLANKRKLQETILVQTILYKIHYQTIQQKLFRLVNQDFLKKRDNLYNKFVISLWDFLYLVRRFIKSYNANTK